MELPGPSSWKRTSRSPTGPSRHYELHPTCISTGSVSTAGSCFWYHGWADPGIAPANSVNYYTSVVELAGADAADSIRLLMAPGMGHCRGGDGTDTFDGIGALDQWVAAGKAPDQIVASRVRKDAIDRARPLCPYPQVARYKGAGSTDDASHFACGAPQ